MTDRPTFGIWVFTPYLFERGRAHPMPQVDGPDASTTLEEVGGRAVATREADVERWCRRFADLVAEGELDRAGRMATLVFLAQEGP